MATFHSCLRELALESAAATTPQFLTSKSCRMLHPTLCDVRGADWGERMAVGNWTECPNVAQHGRHSTIPVRYQGDREASAAFVKILHLMVLRACVARHSERHSGASEVPPLLWSGIRRYISDVVVAEAKEGTAECFSDEEVCEVMEGVQAVPKRSFGIRPRSPPAGDQEMELEDTSPADGTASEAEVTSSDDINLNWIHRDGLASVLHIESELECVPWCRAASGSSFKAPTVRGVGLRNLADEGRTVCQLCIARMPEQVADRIHKLL